MTSLGALFVSTILAAQACLAPTQLTLVVDTNVPCPELKGVAITVSDRPDGAESKGFVTAETSECQGSGRVGTLVVTPSSSGRAAVVVVAGVTRPARECTSANAYEGCIVARRLVTFIDHTALVVPVRLDVDCLNVPCNAISTCSKGKCVSSEASCDGADCSTFGVAADGGTIFVDDASTSNDATADTNVPPADAAPPGDAQADADAEAPSCTFDARVPCNGGRCQSGQVCCQNMTTFAEYCSSSTCNGGERALHCRSSAECDTGLVCCMAPSFSYAQCGSACGSGGAMDGAVPFSFEICSAGCPACRSGTCTPTGSGYASCQ